MTTATDPGLSRAGTALLRRWQDALAKEAEAAVAAALRTLDLDDLDEDDTIDVFIGVLLASARRQAIRAERTLLDLLAAETGTVVAAFGIGSELDADRLSAAFETALVREAEQAAASVRRIVQHESASAGRATMTAAMARSGQVVGWTRVPDENPCKLCTSLLGPILPPDTDMFSHPGCACVPGPVLRGDLQ